MPKKCFMVSAEKTEKFQIVIYAEDEYEINDALEIEYLDDFVDDYSEWEWSVSEVKDVKVDFCIKNGRIEEFSSFAEIDENEDESYVKPGKYDKQLPF
mgnify:CR=1 FL=1